MSQGRSIIDIIQDPAALDAFLRSSAKSSTNPSGSPRISTSTSTNTSDPNRSANNFHPSGNNIYNQNTTNNTNVQITQNTYNFNTNPSLATPTNTSSPSSQLATNETTHVLNQTIGSQTNVNVILNQTVIQQQPTVQTTTATSAAAAAAAAAAGNQQQMVAININGAQTLIPLSMFTKLLQQKNGTAQPPTLNNTTVSNINPQTTPPAILQNGSTQNTSGSVMLQNPSSLGTTVRFVRPPTTTTTTNSPSNVTMMTSGPRLSTPVASKPSTGNIILQVTNNDVQQSKLLDKNPSVSTNSDLTTQLMNDLQVNGKDPEKQIILIDTYLSRMHSSTEKDIEFSKRIIRYRETLSHSVEQARIDGQHRQRLLHQSTTLNTLSSNPSIKREALTPTPSQPTIVTAPIQAQLQSLSSQQQQLKSNGTTLIQLPLAKQEELLNAVLKKLRHVNLPDLQAQGILPMELTFEHKLQIQKLDMQIAALPIDKQQQFARGQRELVPKYLAKNAASGLNTTTTLTVNPRTKILLGALPGSSSAIAAANGNTTRSLRISSADLIGQQLRKDQAYVLKPDFKSRFLTRGDAIKRLTRYHVFTKPAPPAYEPTEDECQQFDDSFEIEAKRLLTVSERINQSISRFAICNDQLNNESYDKYLFEKMRLDDLREQLATDKANHESRKRRALDVENRPVAMSVVDDVTSSPLPPSTFDFLSNPANYHLGTTMSDADYDDLFNSDPISKELLRTSDETQLAINSIVGCAVLDQHINANVHISESANSFFDELDLDNPPQDNNPSQDDEASRAVQNLLGFS